MNAPWSQEAEVSVLSSLLMDSRRCLDLCIQSSITPETFYSRSYSLIFQTIMEMDVENLPVDLTTVTIRLRERDNLESAGGVHGLSQIAVASPTTAYLEHFLGILREKFKSRRLIEICTNAIQCANDSQDALPQLEESLFALGSSGNFQENELKKGVEEFISEIDLRDNPDAVIGMPISLKAWKRSFGGILGSRYYAIGGRPGAGKSALVEQLTLEVLGQGKRVLFLTREMRRDRVIGRMASKLAQVNLSKFLRNYTSQFERDALRKAANDILSKNLFLMNPSSMTGSGLRSLIRRSHRKQPIDLVVIDYMQKLDVEKGVDRFQGIAQNSIQISNAINETGIPVLVVVQLNRESEKDSNRRPRMSDIAEASQIEKDADCISLLWFDKSSENEDPTRKRSIMSITKNRDGACDCDENLWMNGATMHFTDRI